MEPLEQIHENGELIALILRSQYDKPGISFFTEGDLSQQLAYMSHPKGKIIDPHVHNAVKREVFYTQEVLVVRKGRVRVDFYNNEQKYVRSRVLGPWDLVLLIKGGHGFEVLEDLQMYEIKQGPYAGDLDKTRFRFTVNPEEICFD